MRLSVFTIFTAIVFSACGQPAADNIPGSVNNVKTEKHINIPGTKLFMIPPTGFTVAGNFIGLQKDGNTGMQVYDIPGGSFYSNAKTFSKEAFEAKGARVFEYREFSINGFPAKYIFMQGNPETKAYAVVFGDSTFSAMLMGMCLVNDENAITQIKQSMLSITYEKSLKIDPFATASFLLDNNASVFKFAKYAANIFIYSTGGVKKESYDNEPFVNVSSLPADKTMSPESLSEMLMASVEKYGFTDTEIKNRSAEKVNGYDAFEFEAYGKIKGQKSLIYCLVLINGNKAVSIQGMTNSEFEKNITEFKKLSHTIKFR